jgi:hypothetical protein
VGAPAGNYTPAASDAVDGDLSASVKTFLVPDGTQIELSGANAHLFPLGLTHIKNTATNSFGVTTEQAVDITVVDTTAPVVTVAAPASIVTQAEGVDPVVVDYADKVSICGKLVTGFSAQPARVLLFGEAWLRAQTFRSRAFPEQQHIPPPHQTSAMPPTCRPSPSPTARSLAAALMLAQPPWCALFLTQSFGKRSPLLLRTQQWAQKFSRPANGCRSFADDLGPFTLLHPSFPQVTCTVTDDSGNTATGTFNVRVSALSALSNSGNSALFDLIRRPRRICAAVTINPPNHSLGPPFCR